MTRSAKCSGSLCQPSVLEGEKGEKRAWKLASEKSAFGMQAAALHEIVPSSCPRYAVTLLRRIPMPSISTSTTSPSFKAEVWPGVPV